MYRSSCVVYFLDARPGGIAASSPSYERAGRRTVLMVIGARARGVIILGVLDSRKGAGGQCM